MTSSNESAAADFAAVYNATRADLLAYLVRRTTDCDLAADILAETYLVAWRRFDSMPEGEEARPWLFGVARRLLMADFRRQRVAVETVERIGVELAVAHGREAPLDDHRSEALSAALAALSPLDREIVALTAWEGLTPRQVAVVVGSSPNVVRIRLHRARSRLRRELDQAPASAGTAELTTTRA